VLMHLLGIAENRDQGKKNCRKRNEFGFAQHKISPKQKIEPQRQSNSMPNYTRVKSLSRSLTASISLPVRVAVQKQSAKSRLTNGSTGAWQLMRSVRRPSNLYGKLSA
jgi:hypothetical protein